MAQHFLLVEKVLCAPSKPDFAPQSPVSQAKKEKRLWGPVRGWKTIWIVAWSFYRERLQRRKSSRDNEECECACNGEGNRNCDGPTDLEKEQNDAKKKEGEAENENNRKGSKHERDI